MTSSSSPEILLAGSSHGPITAYDTSTCSILAHFNGSRSPRKGLALAGKSLIVASHVSMDTASGSIHLYNWWSSTAFNHLPVPEPVAPLVATLDGSYLFCGGLSGHVHSLALPSGDLICSFPAHCSSPVSCLSVNDDGSLLLSGGVDGTITIFPVLHLLDLTSNDNTQSSSRQSALCRRFAGHASAVTAITAGMGGSGSIIVSCSLDFTCKFWSLADGSLMRTAVFPCMIWGVAMDYTESKFYAGGSDGHVYAGFLKVDRRELRSSGGGAAMGEIVRWAPEHGGAVTAVAMVNMGQNLVSASDDGCIRVWEVESGRVVRVLWNERGNISDLVVAKGIRYGGGVCGFGPGCRRHDCEAQSSLGFSSREISRPVREVSEMEEMLNVVVKDRRGAINTLEAAIGTYQRLLVLILKEAKGGGTENSRAKEATED